jgi:hypothetical protein
MARRGLPVTNFELQTALTALAQPGMSPLQREELHNQVVAELRVRGSFEWNRIHCFVNKQGEIKRGRPW